MKTARQWFRWMKHGGGFIGGIARDLKILGSSFPRLTRQDMTFRNQLSRLHKKRSRKRFKIVLTHHKWEKEMP